MDTSQAEWRKSSFSFENGCVEVAFLDGSVAVRDSKKPGNHVLNFSRVEWSEFLAGVRAGEFNYCRQRLVIGTN